MPRPREAPLAGNKFICLEIEEPPVPVSALPTELLEHILPILADSIDTVEEKKVLFAGLRTTCRWLASLDIVKTVLFTEVHIFTTPTSMARLHGIAQHKDFRNAVRKLTFHRPALGLHEAAWDRYIGGCNWDKATKKREQPDRPSLKAYVHAYLDQQLGLLNGIFEQCWTSLLPSFEKVNTIEVAGSTSRQATMPLVNPQGSPSMLAHIDECQWSRTSEAAQKYMRNLYPDFVAPCWPYLDMLGHHGQDEEAETKCRKFLAMVFRAIANSQLSITRLNVGLDMGLFHTFDWTQYGPILGQVETAELCILERPYHLFYQGGSVDVIDTFVENAPRLKRLRLCAVGGRMDRIELSPVISDRTDNEGECV